MMQKRVEQGAGDESEGGTGVNLLAVETARSAAESSSPKPEDKKSEEQLSVFWRVFGGTILSIVALVSITLYNGIASSLSELRSELNHERAARAELVKKDEFNTRSTSLYERLRSFDGQKAEFEVFKDRANANAASLEALKKDAALTSDAVKKDAATLEVIKERVSGIDGVKKDVAGLDALKEKVTTTAVELKSMRDEVVKLTQEQDRNRTSDMERKTSRDAQSKNLEESLKELQKGVQDCREKLARLEGMQPMARPAPTGPASESKGPGEPGTGGSGKSNPNGLGSGTGGSKPGPDGSKPGPDGQ